MTVATAALADDVPDNDCAPAKGITPICGFQSPEDIDVLPRAGALVVGGLGGFTLDDRNGDIRILRLSDLSIEKIFPPDSGGRTETGGVVWGDATCPGPPPGFSAHGIHVSRNAHGSYTLLVVNHTEREAIEWIELREDAGHFGATWRGCVIVDEELWINDVAMLADGGFVATHMMPRSLAATLFERAPDDRKATGYLVEWQPGRGWRKIEGTEGGTAKRCSGVL